MQIQSTREGSAITCHLSGMFGFSDYEEFSQLLESLTTSNTEQMVIDLSGLSGIETIAVWMLSVIADEAQVNGIGLTIEGAVGEVAKTLELSRGGILGSASADGMDANLCLIADSPIDDDLLEECHKHGIRCGSPPATTGHDINIRYGHAVLPQIQDALTPPSAGFIEMGEDGLSSVGKRCFNAVKRGGLCLSVLTGSTFSLEIPKLIETAIQRRFNFGKRNSDGLLTLCLAEALSNAVIHGNLEIDCSLRASSEGFQKFRQVMNERIANPALSNRRVTITVFSNKDGGLYISISDQGQGFSLTTHPAQPINGRAKSGRGLSLIRTIAKGMWTEDGGRTLVVVM